MLNELLKRVDPTYEDVSKAWWTGPTHPYASFSKEAREVIFARERQLEIAVSLLSEKNRKKVGA
jgi:hypothetical protein